MTSPFPRAHMRSPISAAATVRANSVRRYVPVVLVGAMLVGPSAAAHPSEVSAAHVTPAWGGDVTTSHGVSATMSIPENEKVGVAPVLMVHFNRRLLDHEKDWVIPKATAVTTGAADRSRTDEDSTAASNALPSMTSRREVIGAWRWIDGTTLVWRPKDYLAADTSVTVLIEPAQHLTEPFFAPLTTHFTVAHDLTMRVDGKSHHMEVFRGGELVKTIPVSLGKKTAKHETRSGTKVIVSRHSNYTMRGPADDPYETPVRHALRLTYSGEFFHSAPWSVGSQGRANVSHGCVNIAPKNAEWLYHNTLRFDPAEFVGTDRPMEKWNGPSGAWNWSWAGWTAGKNAVNVVAPI